MSQNTFHNEFAELLVRDALGQYRLATGDEVLKVARQVIGRRVRRGTSMSSPQVVRDYLRTKLAELEHEVFVTLLLDSQNRLIEYIELFRGTLAQTSVYPREVVKVALSRNAAAIFD
jgi:DNA repair protein RadC